MLTPFIINEERGVCFNNSSVTEMSTMKNNIFIPETKNSFSPLYFFRTQAPYDPQPYDLQIWFSSLLWKSQGLEIFLSFFNYLAHFQIKFLSF